MTYKKPKNPIEYIGKDIKFIKIFKTIGLFTLKHSLWGILIVLFVIVINYSKYIFSEEQIFDEFINGSAYTDKCLNIKISNQSIENMYDFLKNEYKQNKLPMLRIHNAVNFKELINHGMNEELFILIVLPVIKEQENVLLKRREKILKLADRMSFYPLEPKEFDYIKEMSQIYEVHLDADNLWDYSLALQELLKKVDIIPTSVILASFIRFVNNLVTNRNVNIDMHDALIKENRPINDEVREYFYAINISKKYASFREYRTRLRKYSKDKMLTSQSLSIANKLDTYSVEYRYENRLSSFIRKYHLTKYNKQITFYDESTKQVCLNLV